MDDYIYDRAKEYEAKMHLLFGMALSTPFCLGLLEFITGKLVPKDYQIIIAIALLVPGLCYLNNSLIIMKERDENHVRFYQRTDS